MSQWTPADWLVFFGGLGSLVALLTANFVTLIKAARDRTAIAAATTTQLTEIAKATGANVTAAPAIVDAVTTTSAPIATLPPSP